MTGRPEVAVSATNECTLMKHRQPRTDFEKAVAYVLRLWYEMPESRLAILADVIAIIGIFGLAFTGRVSGGVAVAGVVVIQGSISMFLYGLARQLQEVEEQYEEPPR